MQKEYQSFRPIGAILIGGFAILTPACATGGAAYQPIVDGPKDAIYMTDLSDCRNVAGTRKYVNSETKMATVIEAGLGGLIGLVNADDATVEDFIGGAIVGAIIGSGDAALNTRQERKSIVMNCMVGRGHRVVG